MSLTRGPLPDLHDALAALRAGRLSAAAGLESCLAAADGDACRAAFLRRFDPAARAVASGVDATFANGAPLPPLGGLAVSVKALFDIAGQPTTAASRAMDDAPPAAADCSAVRRLREAGAAIVGHTNLSEFAYSGVGINPHHGTPVNAGTLALDGIPRVPGGSTSGGATSVATGACYAALGSDTGGSIRIPAALQGLVGFKNTQAATPLDGCVPLSPTLDTSCAITRSVRDAVLVHEVIARREMRPTFRPPRLWRVAVPTTLMLDSLEPAVADAFERTLAQVSRAGVVIERIALEPLARLAAINANGGFAASESWHWHRQRLATRGDRYDPRVAGRIRRGEAISAADYLDLVAARRQWIDAVTAATAGYDALLSPTVPITAPPLAPLLSDDNAFFACNALLLRNPSAVNFLDGCALSLPCHEPGGLPVGLMVWAPAGCDDDVLGLSLTIESLLAAEVR